MFSDSQIDLSSHPATPVSSSPVPETSRTSVVVEFIDEMEPPKKKRKVEQDAGLEVMKQFANEMLRIETERSEIVKGNEEKKMNY